MEPKKISFGFSKINKKLNLTTSKEALKNETKVELIKCLEGQEIKLVEEKPEEQPLIIPLKETQKTSAALASLIKRRAVLLGEEEPEQPSVGENKKLAENNIAPSNNSTEDIEKRAARELLAELQTNGSTDSATNLVLPVVKPDDLPLEGAKESSLDDYESIPIQDFGKAMLRGMGWTEPAKVATKGGPPVDDTPMVRPKGMGLGADKALKKQPLLVAPESNEVLEIKRNAYVRILGGKHKDLYGQIEGFDDHAGRVIVKMAIGGFKEAFNEFLCQPVSRKEYAQYGKCINSTKYEEYKKKENEFGQIILKKDELDKLERNSKDHKNIKKERRDSSDYQASDYKYHKDNAVKEGKSEKYKDDEKYRHKDNEREYKREKNEDDEKDRKKDVKTEKHREDAKVRSRDRDEEREIKRENNREDGNERKRENYRDNDKDNDKDSRREDNRAKEKDHQKQLDRDNGRDHNRSKERDEEKTRNRDKDDERDHKRANHRDNDRDRKRENLKDEDRDRKRENYRDNDRDNRRENNRHGEKDYRYELDRNNERDTKRNKERDEEPNRNRERERYEAKYRDRERNNRDRDYYRDRDTDRNIKRNDKVIQIDDSSDSHKPKKLSTKETKSKKKSKKSKKSKSKRRNDTSDSETSSTSSSDSSSDSEEEEKRKKHKKKTKKSKKQRERSRSRGRR